MHSRRVIVARLAAALLAAVLAVSCAAAVCGLYRPTTSLGRGRHARRRGRTAGGGGRLPADLCAVELALSFDLSRAMRAAKALEIC
ncbi:MAG: hypothetical protein MUF84_18700 [Anaerolineae bacterium]|nr:hypothetical protein [Anaerolineae bacterium]